MDPIAALGAAGSIVQFVDFAARVVSKGNQIYHSGDGLLQEHHDIHVVTSDLLVLKTKLEQLGASAVSKPQGEDDRVFHKLLKEATILAEQLLVRLTAVKGQGASRRWKSLRQAVKSVCSKKEVDDMARRLALYKDQLQLRILVSVRERMDSAISRQAADAARAEQTLQKIIDGTSWNQVKSDPGLHSTSSNLAGIDGYEHESTASSGIDIVSSLERAIEGFKKTLRPPSEREEIYNLLPKAPKSKADEIAYEAILKTIRYPGMEMRFDLVSRAHAKTFQWIFKDPRAFSKPWDDFSLWLRQGTGIYWFTGKAASGKSTLTKYVVQQSETSLYLEEWGCGKCIVASFFFWALGPPVQKSQSGLLRSLLCQILEAEPSLMRVALPEQLWNIFSKEPWDMLESLKGSWHRWSLAQLRECLEKVLTQTTTPLKFCLFIDGLDELDGNHNEIAQFCQHVASFASTKICLSSRPLLVFEEAFEAYSHLRLQDLTREDIRLYVTDKFRIHSRKEEVDKENNDQLSQLIEEVVIMSSGIFLWVALVTKSLLKGLMNHDSISDLRKRLQGLPPELDDLYTTMLESIHPQFYREQASRLFQIVYHSKPPLSALQVFFACCANDAVEQDVFQKLKCHLGQSQVAARIKSLAIRLKTRCAGLLELNNYICEGLESSYKMPSCLVQFLHLSVRDFLEKQDVWQSLLKETSQTSFDPNVALLRSKILVLQISEHYKFQRNATMVALGSYLTNTHIGHAFDYARQAEASTNVAPIKLVDQMGQLPGIEEFRWRETTSFMDILARQGLTLCIKAKLALWEHRPATHSAQFPLLLDAALSNRSTSHNTEVFGRGPEPIYLSTVAALLRHGYDPNGKTFLATATTWERFLFRFGQLLGASEVLDRHQIKTRVDVCRLMLMYGANESGECVQQPESGVASTLLDRVLIYLDSDTADTLRSLTCKNYGIRKKRKHNDHDSMSAHREVECNHRHESKNQKNNAFDPFATFNHSLSAKGPYNKRPGELARRDVRSSYHRSEPPRTGGPSWQEGLPRYAGQNSANQCFSRRPDLYDESYGRYDARLSRQNTANSRKRFRTPSPPRDRRTGYKQRRYH